LVEESERMIEDTKKRLGAAVHELRDLIVGFFRFALLIDPSSCPR
jgi:hypothetical protein